MLYGLLQLSFWGYIFATLILTQITIAAVTIYLHRHQSHRALDLHPIPSHFFRFWLWLTTGMVTKEWVAIHRKHHAKTEMDADPHSPQIYGLRKVLLEGTELYREEAKNQETIDNYGQGTPNDWLERHVYVPYCSLGITLMLLIDLFLFGVPGITIWAVQMIWIPFFAAGVINGVGHYFGYRNFECPDASRNIIPWGILVAGEELHNNHHTYASCAKLSVKWWEFDLGWFYIRTLAFLKLATVRKVPPKLERLLTKTHMDIDTIKALFTNRFQILSHYTKEVIKPVLLAEKRKANKAHLARFKRAKRLLTREASLLSPAAKKHLASLLETYNHLKCVYEFRVRLQSIWSNQTSNPKELIEALQQWCKQAEETGIDVLKRFAQSLQGISTVQLA